MPCCPSFTVKMQNQVAAAIQDPYEQLKDEQNRSPYDYSTKAVTAYLSKQAAPSLLPNLQTVTS